jgi:hypothetical protein
MDGFTAPGHLFPAREGQIHRPAVTANAHGNIEVCALNIVHHKCFGR